MKRLSTAALLAALLTAAACGTETTAPTSSMAPPSAPQASLIGGLVGTITSAATSIVAGQTWLLPVKQPITVSANVTPTSGAYLSIPTLGVLVNIPKGAVSVPTTITMTALPGNVVALDFQPAGTKFNVPIHVTQNMLFTHWLGQPFDVAYFKSTSDINNTKNTINASEFLNVVQLGPIATYDVWHFSGYAAAAGRQ
jgi:hypothetical protein